MWKQLHRPGIEQNQNVIYGNKKGCALYLILYFAFISVSNHTICILIIKTTKLRVFLMETHI